MRGSGKGEILDLENLRLRLTEAAAHGLSPTSRALESLSVPLGWLEAGADLERDVLPSLAIVSRHQPKGTIQSWAYFSRPVAIARKRREAGLPPTEILMTKHEAFMAKVYAMNPRNRRAQQ